MASNMYKETMETVLDEIKRALYSIHDESVEEFLTKLLLAEKVFVIGVGRVFLSLQSMVKRLAHLGIDAHYVGEITEPPITGRDMLIVGSGSGASIFPLVIAKKARSIGAFIVHIGSNPDSELKPITDLMIRIPVRTKLRLEDEIDSCQPMTSLFEQAVMLFGDMACKMIIERKKLDMCELVMKHANLE